mmetsp:Transcript_19064/g.21883  ORF Transcript_19064/g.21883 Transcript_19064/m.21883 type:complete len:123 (+) Transcript_19064:209-577(+)
MKYWPILYFDPTMKENDEDWKLDIRETINELRHRISLFLHMLVQRNESVIVVVTHGVWMEVCLQMYFPEVVDHGKRRIYNSDMVAVDCVSSSSLSSLQYTTTTSGGDDEERDFVRFENVRFI